MNWSEAKEVKDLAGVKYLRLRNNSEKDVTVDITKIGMDIKSLKPEAKLLQSTIKNGLSEGDVYKMYFDGNLSTYILTKRKSGERFLYYI